MRRGRNADRLERLSLSTLLITYLSAFYFLGELENNAIRALIATVVIALNVFFVSYFLYEYFYDKAEDLELGQRVRNSSVFRAFAKTLAGSEAGGSRPASLNFDSPTKKRSQLSKKFNPTMRQSSFREDDTAARLSYARAKGSPKTRKGSRAGRGHGRNSSTGLLAISNGHASKRSRQLREIELGTITEKKPSAGDVSLPPGWERHDAANGKPCEYALLR